MKYFIQGIVVGCVEEITDEKIHPKLEVFIEAIVQIFGALVILEHLVIRIIEKNIALINTFIHQKIKM
jgi:hypothetical protein